MKTEYPQPITGNTPKQEITKRFPVFFAPIFGIFENRRYYAVKKGNQLLELANLKVIRGGQTKRNFRKFPPILPCVVL